MKKYFYILFCIFYFACPAYDPPLDTFQVHNYSDYAIYVYKSCNDSVQLQPALKLFLKNRAEMYDENEQNKLPLYSPEYRVNAYTYGDLSITGSINDYEFPCKENFHLFIISEKTMRNYTWNNIVKHQMYEKHFDLSVEDLDSLNWKVRYVP